jgi:quinol-cytochrome oxidoreductase complex cytochrome b subunit
MNRNKKLYTTTFIRFLLTEPLGWIFIAACIVLGILGYYELCILAGILFLSNLFIDVWFYLYYMGKSEEKQLQGTDESA